MSDARQRSESTRRNREPLRDALAAHLPASGALLEIAAGSGEHAVFLAPAFPGLRWQATDRDPAAVASIAAWIAAEPAANLLPPLRLDVADRPWPGGPYDAILCANMIHISPWSASEALFAGAAEVLGPGGRLLTYGAYKVGGEHTAPSNAAFDRWLRERDPAWGVRDVEALDELARAGGLVPGPRTQMPANNLLLRFDRP